MKNYLSVISSLLIAVLLFSCGNTANQHGEEEKEDSLSSENILEEIEFSKLDFDIPFADYQISSSKSEKIVTESGSEIDIPANAFVFEDGTIFTGETTIKYREVISAGDIIASDVCNKLMPP